MYMLLRPLGTYSKGSLLICKNKDIRYPKTYKETKVYQITVKYEILSYESMEGENVRNGVHEQDGAFGYLINSVIKVILNITIVG